MDFCERLDRLERSLLLERELSGDARRFLPDLGVVLDFDPT